MVKFSQINTFGRITRVSRETITSLKTYENHLIFTNKNLNLIGKSWSSLLGLKNPIPGWMVSLMYVQSKIIRARKKFKADNYDDAANYLYQAKLMQEEQQKK